MGRHKGQNLVLEDNGDWLLIDISTPKHHDATMAIDKDVWDRREGGRVHAFKCVDAKYIYAKHSYEGKCSLFHHQVIQKVDGLTVDHKTHGTMTFIDNRRSNLRSVTHAQNCMNISTPLNNTSGTRGISWNKQDGRWSSYIIIDGKYKHLGRFDNIDIAIGARQQAEREYFGEYAFGANN